MVACVSATGGTLPGVVRDRRAAWRPHRGAPRIPRIAHSASRRWSTATAATWACLTGFAGFQLLTILLWANGPSLDESIYITAGRRTLEGHGLDDRYLTWFAGSLVWPLFAGVGDMVAGLEGARVVAAGFVTLGLASSVAATGMLFGPRARLAAAALGVTFGPILALGHLAVYDAMAFGLLGLALVAVVLAARRDHRIYVVLAATAFTGAVLAKYPVLPLGVALVGLLIAIRGARSRADLILGGVICAAILLIYVTPQRQQLSEFLDWRADNSPSFGVTRDIIAFEQLWLLLLPVMLAVAGIVAAGPRRRAIALSLCVGLVIVPVYHLSVGDSVGATKHAALAVLLALPVCGLGVAAVAEAERLRALLIPALAAWVALGVVESREFDRGWLNIGAATAFVGERAQPGDTVLANASWPFVLRLYDEGIISSPWQVYDNYRVKRGDAGPDLCRHTWFIDTQGETEWGADVRERIARCPNFRLVRAERQRLVTIGPRGPFPYTAWIRIWRSTAA